MYDYELFGQFLFHLYREDVEKMFTELDKDFDGKLSWKEFIGEETSIEIAFKLFDENKDGSISKGVCFVKQFCHK